MDKTLFIFQSIKGIPTYRVLEVTESEAINRLSQILSSSEYNTFKERYDRNAYVIHVKDDYMYPEWGGKK